MDKDDWPLIERAAENGMINFKTGRLESNFDLIILT